jgi:trehalose 6-phosphate phosphatase
MHWTSNRERLLNLVTTSLFGIISDFDGTLSFFAPYPPDAVIDSSISNTLDTLATQGAKIALVSGRAADDLYRRFPRPYALYYGNHGMEVWRDGAVEVARAAQMWHEPLQALLEVAKQHTVGDSNVLIENKRVTASIHYRMAEDREKMRVVLYDLLLPLCEQYGFRLSEGQFIWEIKPPVTLNKGTAAEEIVEILGLESVLFLGDDVTDFTAMQRLRELSSERLQVLSVGVVRPTSKPELYDYCDITANGVGEVGELLNWVSEQREGVKNV